MAHPIQCSHDHLFSSLTSHTWICFVYKSLFILIRCYRKQRDCDPKNLRKLEMSSFLLDEFHPENFHFLHSDGLRPFSGMQKVFDKTTN